MFETRNDETFGASSSVVSKSFGNLTTGKTDDGAQVSYCSSSKVTIRTLLTSQVYGFPVDWAVNICKISSTIKGSQPL